MHNTVVFGLACFGLGLVTGVFVILTVIVKVMSGAKRVIRPPKLGGGKPGL